MYSGRCTAAGPDNKRPKPAPRTWRHAHHAHRAASNNTRINARQSLMQGQKSPVYPLATGTTTTHLSHEVDLGVVTTTHTQVLCLGLTQAMLYTDAAAASVDWSGKRGGVTGVEAVPA